MRSFRRRGIWDRFAAPGLFYLGLGAGSVLGCGSETPVNDAPVAAADSAAVDEDSNVLIDVLDNDSDAEDGKPVLDSIVSEPVNGSYKNRA
jgi:hypothetical protein